MNEEIEFGFELRKGRRRLLSETKPVPGVKVMTPITQRAAGTCYYHPELPAAYICNRCGRAICHADVKTHLDLILCPQCFHMVAPVLGAPTPMAPPVAGAPPGFGQRFGLPPFGLPFPFRFGPTFKWSYAIAAAAGLLIIINAAALLSPVFFAFWVSLFPWVASLGSFGFILGIILGILVLGAVLLMIVGHRLFGVFIIFPAAIVSLFIGGGFIAGLVLGILASILAILNY